MSTYKQEQSSKSSNPLQGLSSRTLVIDPNMYLLNTVDGTADGAMVPNPNFGKPVMGGLWQGNNLGSDRSSTRLTGFAEVRFDDFMDDSLALKILGRVKFTGLVQNRTSHSLESYGRYKIDPVAVTTALEGDAALSYATLRTGSIFGLPHNEGIDYLNINSLSDLQGANIGAVSYGSDRDRPFQGGTWTGWSQSDNAYVDFPAATYNMDDGNNYPASFYASKRLTKLESKVVVAQHYLWNNGLVLTGTWRNDRQSTASKSAPAGIGGSVLSQADLVNHPTYAIGPRSSDLEESADEDATSWGVTAHLRELIGSEVPDISFYYTDSSNFQPTSGRVNIFNEEIDSVTGSTVEKGIIYDAMEGKLSLRLNKFESGVLNNSFDGGPVSASEGILLGLARELDNAANVAQGFTAANSQSVLPPQGVIDVNGFVPDWANAEASTARNSSDSGSQDYTAEGYELEVAYNPIPQWTTMVGVAKQSTVTSNIFPAMKNYINDFVIPNWVNSDFAKNYYIDELGTETLAERAMRTLVTPVAASLTLEGIPSIEQREWRFNLNTSYHFEEGSGVIPGFLGDFTVGGGYRWEDKVGIGFHVAENEFGQMALDPNNPFYGPKQDFVDLFFRSEYTLKGENTLSVQLNIKDLFDNDDLVPTYANPDGTKVYRFLRGRLVTVSATYGF